MVGARDAVINENEPNCLWKFAGGERQIGTHVRKPTFRVAGERPGGPSPRSGEFPPRFWNCRPGRDDMYEDAIRAEP